jgi:hypothetical protein
MLPGKRRLKVGAWQVHGSLIGYTSPMLRRLLPLLFGALLLIAPGSAGAEPIPQAVYFADPEHGWALAEEGDEPHPRPALFATSDGGRSWTRSPISIGSRYAGPIVFSSARDGWLAEEGPDPALYRTRNGGRTWTEVRLPRAPWLVSARADYLPPQFEPDGHGILASTYDNFEKPAYTFLYKTSDFGRHWKLATKVRLIVDGDPAVYAYRGPETLLSGLEESPRLGLLSLDGTTSTLTGSGLPTEYSPRLSFSGTEDGFARIEAEDCNVTAKRANCTEVNGLYFTSDGGDSWAPTTRP